MADKKKEKKTTKQKKDVKPGLVHQHEGSGVEHAHSGGDEHHEHDELPSFEKRPFGEPIDQDYEPTEAPPMGKPVIDQLVQTMFPVGSPMGPESPEDRDERLRDRALVIAGGVHHGEIHHEKVVSAAEAYYSFLKGDADAEVKVLRGDV